ncbi:MAG: alpha/beta hydrolase-fold protein [Desulfobacterales bacterium]|jgi:predicted alpha/beta superfamily hydrolase
MDLKIVGDIRNCCETPNSGTLIETKIQPDSTPEKNADLMGSLHHFADLPSRFVKPRNVDVWLPPNYGDGAISGYNVLYMHDGQNLFQSEKSFMGVDWGLDQTMAVLYQKNKIRPTIVIGVWNTPQRMCEYLPQRPFCDYQSQPSRSRVIKRYGGAPISDKYLRFLVDELKPFVDRRYRTRPEREFTFVMGSSMGGLISLYAICEYPHIFGGAGCLSTHWPIAHRSFIKYLRARLPEPRHHKIYLDYGDEANSSGYLVRQRHVEHIIREKGYTRELDWLANWYAGDPHSETAWRTRVHVPLQFLLKDDPQ